MCSAWYKTRVVKSDVTIQETHTARRLRKRPRLNYELGVTDISYSCFQPVPEGTMRPPLTLTLCLLLLVGMGDPALGNKQKKKKNACSSSVADEEDSGSSVLASASTTGSIHIKAERSFQYFDEECHTEEAREYRTADGSCNHVYNRGSANTPFKRLLPPEYGDSINSPRAFDSDDRPLPIPTDVSRLVHFHKDAISSMTTMFMQWGQFIDHDITLTPVPSGSDGAIKCCGPNGTTLAWSAHPDCYPILLSADDADHRFTGNCMEFIRSLAARRPNTHEQMIPREQINRITAFIDGSMIYGSSEELQHQLRETTADGTPGSKMKTTANNLMPRDTSADCVSRPDNFCFLAGDIRVNVQPGLVVIHTMWVRLHNAIVDGLKPQRPHDTPEQLFQEARKVVIGILQMVNYNEFLPLVLGNTTQSRYNLWPHKNRGQRSGYSSAVDPRMMNSFSTAAFRFGHSNIPKHLNVSGVVHKFRDLWFHTDLLFDDFDGVVRSLLDPSANSRAQKGDRFLVDDITGHLFEPDDQPEEEPSHGLDLAALNIQRGRDHGLPPYNMFRRICGLAPISNFSEFGDVAQTLSSLYSSVDDIDLFVGGLLEKHEGNGDVGATFACIIAQQFHALKYGDSFYFETDREPEGFSDDQLQAIRSVSFAKVCCLTSNITTAWENVFTAKGRTLTCADVRNNFLDYSLWKKD